MLGLVLPDPQVAARIVRTAEVTARLYALQIEEIAT
jgi:3-oxoacyl-[acyl-carrier-protein] synthase-3